MTIENNAAIKSEINDVNSTGEVRKLFEKIGDELSEGIEACIKSYVGAMNLGPDITYKETGKIVALTDAIAYRLTIAHFAK